jgi:hypothetical protein
MPEPSPADLQKAAKHLDLAEIDSEVMLNRRSQGRIGSRSWSGERPGRPGYRDFR